jgi:hypothetical protein
VERVPEFGAALKAPGCDYIQLHVSYGAEPLPGVAHGAAEQEQTDRVTVLGSFAPAGDLTCTTIRFALNAEHTQVRTFFGGAPGGLSAAAVLTNRVIEALRTLKTDVDRPLADVI